MHRLDGFQHPKIVTLASKCTGQWLKNRLVIPAGNYKKLSEIARDDTFRAQLRPKKFSLDAKCRPHKKVPIFRYLLLITTTNIS